jgi:catechol 2,3-dioxygenase-like lactoylglutathione lyase family enzyme
MPDFELETLHHVSIPVTDLEAARRFYGEILGLQEIERPAFDFGGAWYRLGGRQLHLIRDEKGTSTFRAGKTLDARDAHFALRVKSYRLTRDFLRSKGYSEDAQDELMRMKESPQNPTPWRQLYIMDPDRNVIELNADREAE